MNKLIIFISIIFLTAQSTFRLLSQMRMNGESLGDTLNRMNVLGYNQSKPTFNYDQSILSSYQDPQIAKLFYNYTFPLPTILQENIQTQKDTVTDAQVCTYTLMHYSNSTSQFLNFNTASSDLYPGSLISATNINSVLSGTNLQTPIPVNNTLLRPSLTLYDLFSKTYPNQTYKKVFIQNNIARLIKAQKNQQTPDIYYDIGTTDQLADFGNRLGFNGGLLTQLGITNPSILTTYKKKYIWMFAKAMGVFSVPIVPVAGKNITPFKVFFKDMTKDQFTSYSPSYWGKGNTPLYISSATYGSIMFITLDYSQSTTDLKNQFTTAVKSRSGVGQALVALLADPTANYYSYGSFGPLKKQDITADLTLFDMWFKSPSPSATNLGPILYSVSSFNSLQYDCQNQFNYTTISCTQLPN